MAGRAVGIPMERLMTVLTVGQGQQFARLSDAIAAAANGDLLQVQAGTYANDFATINKALIIEGVGGMVRLVATTSPSNGKAVLVTQADVTLRNIEISGARVDDRNGAAVRHENGKLVLDRVYFHNNQNGVLAGENPNSSIMVTNSEFAFNGDGDGQSHGMYAGKIAELTIRDSFFHGAAVGHEVKSRALSTTVENSRILNGLDGTGSYAIDLPNGGNAVVRGNVIGKGPQAQNPHTVHFGGEGTPHASSSLLVSGNTVVNSLGNGQFVLNQTGMPATVSGNSLFGFNSNDLLRGTGTASGNTQLNARPGIDATPIDFRQAAELQRSLSGPDTLVLSLSQDAWQGNARFSVTVDGKSLGPAQEVTVLRGSGAKQDFTFRGDFGTGQHRIGIGFLNDAYGGTGDSDRNLYVEAASLNGQTIAGAARPLFSNGESELPAVTAAPPPPDTLIMTLSQDAWQGNAKFTVMVDGKLIGPAQEVIALRKSGATQDFTFRGSFGPGQHKISVAFLNDAYGGTGATDRNLYVEGASLNGVAVPNASKSLYSAGAFEFTTVVSLLPPPPPPDTLVLSLSQDAWQGNAKFTVTVDGTSLGPAQEVTALRRDGAVQDFTFRGNFGSGPRKVSVAFLNDAYGGTGATDRNLYVEGASLNGVAVPNAAKSLYSTGAFEFGPDGPILSAVSATLLGPAWAAETVTWSIDQPAGHHLSFKLDQATGQYLPHQFDQAIGDQYEALMQRAVGRWDAALGVDFRQVGAIGAGTAPADIVIGFDDLDLDPNNGGVIGYAHYAYDQTAESRQVFRPGVTVRLQDPAKTPLLPIEGGDYRYSGYTSTLYQVVLHELGHALGLGHSSDPGSIMHSVVGRGVGDLALSDIADARKIYGPDLDAGAAPLLAAGASAQIAFLAHRGSEAALAAGADAPSLPWRTGRLDGEMLASLLRNAGLQPGLPSSVWSAATPSEPASCSAWGTVMQSLQTGDPDPLFHAS